jgi:hypothetical protein
MNNKIGPILLIISLVLYGCSDTQRTQNPTSTHEVDINAPLPPKWMPTNTPQFTSTSTEIPTSTKTLTSTITSTPSITPTETILPPVLTWRNYSGKLAYETAEWIDYDLNLLAHRNIDGCRIETIGGRGLPSGWSPSFDTQTIGGLTWDRVRWSHDGVLKLATFRIPLEDETGYSVWGGISVYACMRAAEAVLETYQPNK